MAEFQFRDFLKKKGTEQCFTVSSAATSAEEIGNFVYPPARAELKKHGISAEGKRAIRLRKEDYERYDYILCMEERNVQAAKRIFGGDTARKVKRLLDYADGGDIADPWYTGNFARTYEDIERGIEGFYKTIERNL